MSGLEWRYRNTYPKISLSGAFGFNSIDGGTFF